MSVKDRLLSLPSPSKLRLNLYQPTLYTIIIFLILWQITSMAFAERDFPGLIQLAETMAVIISGSGEFSFVGNTRVTLERIAVGYILAMTTGVALGIAMGLSRFREYLTTPLIIALNFPAIVWTFIFVMWLGFTDYLVVVLVLFASVTPYIAVNIWKGAEDIDSDLLAMANSFNFSEIYLYRHVLIPSLLPYIFASARLGFAVTWKLSLVAEIFGTSSGLGYVIFYYFDLTRADMMIAWSLPIMLLMFGIERLLKRIERRTFAWRPDINDLHQGATG